MKDTAVLYEKLSGALPPDRITQRDADLFVYSRDCWPKTIMWTEDGRRPYNPDAVVFPRNAGEVASVVKACAELDVPVIPYGGGSGVCGGVVPVKGGVSIDLKAMKSLHGIDPVNLVAEVDAGIMGSHIEEKLNAAGFTLGHFPSSIMCSTVGGWLAARSAGQCSSRYGKIEDMVVGLEAVMADGRIVRIKPPLIHSGGVDWNAILVGSEGTLGIITKAWLKVRPQPEHQRFLGISFPSLEAGLDAMREVMQTGLKPAVIRLYDPLDTFINKLHGSPQDSSLSSLMLDQQALFSVLMDETAGAMKLKAMNRMLRRPGIVNRLANRLPGAVSMITIFEGSQPIADAAHDAAVKIFLRHKGELKGEEPARYWMKKRYSISFKQMGVFRSGSVVDTMEVSAPWEQVPKIFHAVRKNLTSLAYVMCHFSHAYHDGCALYFSFATAAAERDAMYDRYDKVWSTALSTVQENGGTLSHHHGVGLSKSGLMLAEQGSLLGVFGSLKQRMDEPGIMNPSKLGL